jgi:hypothetical protein
MNDRPAINQQELSARRTVVALAHAMLAKDISFFEGAVAVLRLRCEIGGVADRDPDFDAFLLMESETDHLPLKAQQHLWNPGALAKLAPEFQKTEEWAAGFVAPACEGLLRRFGGVAVMTADPALQPTASVGSR